MKILLILVGLIFIIAGIATGVVSQIDYGKALIGLNLGLAATLLVGGFVVIGLASIAGAIAKLTTSDPETTAGDQSMSFEPVREPVMEDDRTPSPVAVATLGAAAGAAGMAISDKIEDAESNINTAIDKVAEVAKEAKEKAEQAAEKISEDVSEKVEETKEAAADVVEDVKETRKKETEDKAEDGDAKDKSDNEADTSDDAQENEDTKDGDDEDQLFIVEELVIRGKSARVLSDDTVEAETAEGWMRFENVAHLEEYLDAMEG